MPDDKKSSVDADWQHELIEASRQLSIEPRDPAIDPSVEMSPATALVLEKLAVKILTGLAERHKRRHEDRAAVAPKPDAIDAWWQQVIDWFGHVSQMMTQPIVRPNPIPIPNPPKPPGPELSRDLESTDTSWLRTHHHRPGTKKRSAGARQDNRPSETSKP